MKTVVILSLGAFLWAQSLQVNPGALKPRGVINLHVGGNSPALRTNTVDWLLPNQDYAIVPASASDPDYAGDTLISNGTGPNTRSAPPPNCVGTFLSSSTQLISLSVMNASRLALVILIWE